MKLIDNRLYLNDLEYLTEYLTGIIILDEKSVEFYKKINNLIDNEYDRVYKELKKEEIKLMKKGKRKNDISK